MLTSSYLPQSGRFLISEPFMFDQNFQRTVVLMVEHNQQGSLGFVLNRQLTVSIDEVVEDLPHMGAPVFIGGPVEQSTLHFVHRIGSQITHSKEIAEGVYWGGDFDQLKNMLLNGQVMDDEVLFFVGYSGWGPGQLEAELERKSWIVAPENPTFIFREDYEDMWREVLRSMGKKYEVISNYPVDPRLN
ncbi:MAG: YqgE/AlgH family protein [Bacteroidota bacterium]